METVAMAPLDSPRSLTEAAAARLREQIIAGRFRPGQRLVEAEIARQLQISRGPVREALAQLRTEGLAYEEPRRGSFVADLTPHDVQEIYELRAALEGRAAHLIIERNDARAFTRLAEVMDELRQAARSDDRDGFAHLDALFHAELCRTSGNQRLYRAFRQQAGLLSALLRLEITTQYDSLDEIIAEHERLFADLTSGDIRRAEAGCDRHMQHAIAHVAKMRSASAQPPRLASGHLKRQGVAMAAGRPG